MKEEPLIGSPPMPTLVETPIPSAVIWDAASYPSVPERPTIPTDPGFVDMVRHDAEQRLAGRNDAGAVGPDQPHATVRA